MQEVLDGFDNEACKCAIRCTWARSKWGKKRRRWQVLCGSGFVDALQHRCFVVSSLTWTSETVQRVVKYANKGFTPLVCGLNKRCAWQLLLNSIPPDVRDTVARTHDHSHLLPFAKGVQILLVLERIIDNHPAHADPLAVCRTVLDKFQLLAQPYDTGLYSVYSRDVWTDHIHAGPSMGPIATLTDLVPPENIVCTQHMYRGLTCSP